MGLITLMILIGLLGGASKWATQQRMKRKYQDKYKDCCGTDCGCHEKKGKK